MFIIFPSDSNMLEGKLPYQSLKIKVLFKKIYNYNDINIYKQ